jgi:multicomponent Na+:H+ antiporter subunit D
VDNINILFSVILPIVVGCELLIMPARAFKTRSLLLRLTSVYMVVPSIVSLWVVIAMEGKEITLFRLVEDIPVYFKVDSLGRLFAAVIIIVFLAAGFYSFEYMKHCESIAVEKRYYGFYIITFGVLMGLCFSGNMITLYMFYEFMTLASMPLVISEGTREAIMAGLKYLFYSFCGAYMALFGIYFLYKHTTTLDFVAGGSLDLGSFGDGTEFKIFLVAVFLMIIGFGVKAGSFPLHAWLPTAHPVAPAPASAFLSGIIVKGGVLAIIRSVYYVVGADNIRGTWVQYTWIILAVITIVMGSSLAFKERILKKRFAYSTVSNLSYILLGLAMLNETAYTGAMLHVVFHAFIKSALFMVAGALIFTTGKNKVNDFVGLGRKMPILFTAYIVVSLGLIGIPPTSGVVSKWYLAIGSLNSGTGALAWIGPVALLVSALLTAGYLLPIAIRGFLKNPEDEMMLEQYREPSFLMVAPIVLMAVVTLVLGLYPTPLINFIMSIGSTIL